MVSLWGKRKAIGDGLSIDGSASAMDFAIEDLASCSGFDDGMVHGGTGMATCEE